MCVTAAVHRFINYLKQYEKCDPAVGETTLNPDCEPDNLSSYEYTNLKTRRQDL